MLVETTNPRLLQLFFDDHILPWDAHIVDVRHGASPCEEAASLELAPRPAHRAGGPVRGPLFCVT